MRIGFLKITSALRDERGSTAVETALVFAFLLVPMLASGIELYSFKSRTAAMSRESYQVALTLAASPDDERTDTDIINFYRQTFPDTDDTISVASYCVCVSQIQSYQPGDTINTCENTCPPSERIIWKKVTVTRNYTPMINSKFVGEAKLKVAHLFRNS